MTGKICFLIGNLNLSGGTERVTTLVANALAAQGEQVCILNLSQGNQPFSLWMPALKIRRCIHMQFP